MASIRSGLLILTLPGYVLSLYLQQFWPVVPFAVAALVLNLFVSPRLDSDLDAA